MAPELRPRKSAAGGSSREASPSRRKAGEKGKRYTLEEVGRHSTPGDCWLIVRGKVYDMSEWAPKHPGGDLIYLQAGRDVTQLFESYHPLYVRDMLGKFCIGELDATKGEKPITYEDESEFYVELKKRVEAYFKKEGKSMRDAPKMYAKSASIFGMLALGYYLTFFAFESLAYSALGAVLLGFAFAEVGVSIQHDGNHGGYSNKPWLCRLSGISLDLVGASSYMWKQQHDVGHHAYTNVDGLDPDIRVKDPDVRRVTLAQPHQSYQKYQHIYLAFLYGLLALKSVLFDDFLAISKGAIGNITFGPLPLIEKVILFGGKIIFFTYTLVIPSMYLPVWRVVLLFVAAEMITGWCLAFMFQVAHVVEQVDFYEVQEGRRVKVDWATSQLATTANFSPQSSFWKFVSGGLNYQVEHHLFPTISHVYYDEIAPIVEKTAKEYGIPYNCYPSFWSALASHFKWLKKAGSGMKFSQMSLGNM
eukprot:tig00001030_g6451.t1